MASISHEHESEKGVHGTWLPIAMFEKHLKLMKWLGYETLTFADLADKGFIHRLQYDKKYSYVSMLIYANFRGPSKNAWFA